jgi:5-(carboxyamino)imidazole ribonucleotide mutase
MGSSSDASVMEAAAEVLDELMVTSEMRVVSAHRTPDVMVAFGREAAGRGIKVIGGAAHLPGMLAALTVLPVVGVPVPLRLLDGLDSLLSIVQMPNGVPVATVGIGAARNAGLLAARILAIHDTALAGRLTGFADALAEQARTQDEEMTTP